MWCIKADVEDNRGSVSDMWKGHVRIHAWQKSAGSVHGMLALCASQKGCSVCLSAHILSRESGYPALQSHPVPSLLRWDCHHAASIDI